MKGALARILQPPRIEVRADPLLADAGAESGSLSKDWTPGLIDDLEESPFVLGNWAEQVEDDPVQICNEGFGVGGFSNDCRRVLSGAKNLDRLHGEPEGFRRLAETLDENGTVGIREDLSIVDVADTAAGVLEDFSVRQGDIDVGSDELA